VKILYFAWLRERVGHGEEDVVLPVDVASVADLIGWLRTKSPGHEHALAQGRVVRCAVDQSFATPETSIIGAREIAFFPPVTGG
jgi:molybdopterin synthase sulfur carrier subunit